MNTWKKKYQALEQDWQNSNKRLREASQRQKETREKLENEILYLRGVLRSMSVVVKGIADGHHVDFLEIRNPQ